MNEWCWTDGRTLTGTASPSRVLLGLCAPCPGPSLSQQEALPGGPPPQFSDSPATLSPRPLDGLCPPPSQTRPAGSHLRPFSRPVPLPGPLPSLPVPLAPDGGCSGPPSWPSLCSPPDGPPSRSFATPDSSLPDVLVRGPSPPPERERPEGGGRGGLVSCCAVPQPRCPAGTFLGRVNGDAVPMRHRAVELGTESPGRVTGRAGTPGPSSGAHCRAAVFNSNLVSGSFC